jgi:hypothetical protein
MTLMNCLSALPASIVGINAFGFLPLIALGRLDAAVANKTRRGAAGSVVVRHDGYPSLSLCRTDGPVRTGDLALVRA